MWNKEYKMLPLPNTWKEVKEKFTEYCKTVNEAVEDLIDSYKPYFESEIKPVLQRPEGDKTLLFRVKRLLENKVIGESSSLFLDLVIWDCRAWIWLLGKGGGVGIDLLGSSLEE